MEQFELGVAAIEGVWGDDETSLEMLSLHGTGHDVDVGVALVLPHSNFNSL